MLVKNLSKVATRWNSGTTRECRTRSPSSNSKCADTKPLSQLVRSWV